jgi:thiamine ABC transporter, permease protein
LVGGGGVLFCAVLIAFFVPLGAAIAPSFASDASAAAFRPLWKAARFTVMQAFLSATGASGIGLCAAFFCARRKFFGRKLLLSLSAIPLSVPPVVIALAFILFFGKNGFVNKLLAAVSAGQLSLGTFLYSTGGIVLVHTFYNFPITMRTVSAAWEQLPEETEQAALLLGASPLRIFRTVIFPALKAPLCASFVIIFLYCFFSFVIILLLGGLGVTTLEVELYQTIRRDIHAGTAARIALLETGIATAAVGLYAYLRSRTPDHVERTQYARTRLNIGGAAESVFFAVLICIICFCLLLPLGSLVWYSLSSPKAPLTITVEAWRQLLQRSHFWLAVWNTVQTGIGTAVFSVTAALFFAYIAFQSNRTWRQSVPLFPFAVSSVVLGVGWLKLDAAPSMLLLVIVQSSLAWPFAWMQIETGLAKIPRSVLDAARLLSSSRTDAFFRVFLPLCKTGIISALCCVFAISAGDASLPLLLHIPNFENLALMLFRFAGSYRFTESAGIAVILALLTGLLFFIQDSVRERGQTH